MTHKHQLVKNRVVPRDQREVYQPIEDCKEFIVSDLVPTDGITSAFITAFQAGTALFGEIDWGNKVEGTPWDNYVCRKITRSGVNGFSRLHFSRNFSEDDLNTPYITIPGWRQGITWDPVLKAVKFIRVSLGTDPVATKPQVARVVYIPEHTDATEIRIEKFVSSSPHVIPRYDTPGATAVSYDFLGINDFFPRCLHGDLIFDPQVNAIVQYTAGEPVSGTSAIVGQSFPATTHEEWLDHVHEDMQEQVEILYVRTRVWVLAPDEPEVSYK